MDEIKNESLESIAGGKFKVEKLENGRYTVVGDEQIFSSQEEAKTWLSNFEKAIKSMTPDSPGPASKIHSKKK